MGKESAVETRTASIWLEDDGIVRAVYKPRMKESLEDALANVEATEKLLGGRKAPLLVDMRDMQSLSREARVFYGSERPAAYSMAQALLCVSPTARVIGNFALGLQRSRFPLRLFTDEKEALKWLRGFLEPETNL